jgi:predicted DNA-binding ribbon-helix-helix protein
MESVSTRLDDETYRDVRETAEERDVSIAEVLRELIEKGTEYDDQVSALETENERLHRERRQLLEQREENKELVQYVEEERGIQQRREERRDAPLWRRARWYVFGRSDDSAEA